MDNKVGQYRKQAKLTQQQLAELAGTSQQQIQRIETGMVATRVELATAIAGALGAELADLFPTLKRIAKRRQKSGLPEFDLEQETLDEYESAGLDVDVRVWTVKLRLRGHQEDLFLDVSSRERARLQNYIAAEDDRIVVFETGSSSVVLNLRHLVYCHFLYDVDMDRPTIEKDEVRAFLDGLVEPLAFVVDDDGTPSEEDEGQFRRLLRSVDNLPSSDVGGQRIDFVDADDEHVYLRADDVALLEIPLWVTTQGELENSNGEHHVDEPTEHEHVSPHRPLTPEMKQTEARAWRRKDGSVIPKGPVKRGRPRKIWN